MSSGDLDDVAVLAAHERLLALVPVHDRVRDTETGGALSALLLAIATELVVLETDLDRLADSWFVETCEEWLLPYLADLVGLRELPPDLGAAVSRRALVANTVGYRRRKGTVAVLEQVARDVTGWPAKAVEHHPLLAATGHVKYVRLDRPALASLRGAATVEQRVVAPVPGARGALDRLAHTIDVRRVESGRGRFNIRNVAVFLAQLVAYEVGAADLGPAGGGPSTGTHGGWAQARPGADPATDGYTFDPLGRATPVVVAARPEESLDHLATEEDLPLPLRPRRLLALLTAARASGAGAATLPLGVRIGTDEDLTPERIRVCRLEDLAPGDDPQVFVDTVAGRVFGYQGGVRADVGEVFVRWTYGGLADVGAGTYDRTAVHENVLDSDDYTPARAVGENPAAGQAHVLANVAESLAPEATVVDVAGGLAAAQDAWADAAHPLDGATFVVSVGDNASYDGDLAVTVPAATRLVLVAAQWPSRELPDGEILAPVPGRYVPDGLRPHVRGTLRITGGPGASVVVDGLLVEGDIVVAPGDLGSLTIAQATVTGRVVVEPDDGDDTNGVGSNGTLSVRAHRAVLSGIAVTGTVPFVAVTECIVDALAPAVPGKVPSGTAIDAVGSALCVVGSTVRGTVAARTLDASSALLDGLVTIAHRQVGCVRYSYVGPDSLTPRRFRCVGGDPLGTAGPTPSYVSIDPASPGYLALHPSCPAAIRTGGEGESEMGVHQHLFRPPRVAAAHRQLEPYVPAGIAIGILGS